jgi:hypothetical protein
MAPQPSVNIPIENLQKLGRVLQIVAAAMLSAQLIFLGAVLIVHHFGMQPVIDDANVFIVLATLVTASCGAVALIITNVLVRLQDSSEDRLFRIRRASMLSILRIAVLEGGGILNTAFYLLTANSIFLAFLAICLLAFIMFRPTPRYFEAFRNMSGAPPIS